jgi:hypothetical protein
MLSGRQTKCSMLPSPRIAKERLPMQSSFVTAERSLFRKHSGICVRLASLEDAVVLNIGKARPGTATLRSRLKQYVRLGQGEAAGHPWGEDTSGS